MFKLVLIFYLSIFTVFSVITAEAESFRTFVSGNLELSSLNPEGSSFSIKHNDAALIHLGGDIRFIRGVELEITAPQAWLAYRGSLAMLMYAGLDHIPSIGVNDLNGHRIAYEPLPSRVKNVYQIPVRSSHGLRTSPYATVLASTILPSAFPILFRIIPIIKDISEELENMQFVITTKPILSDEGAVRISPRYPQHLRGRPFTVLINDVVIENIAEERLLREGEHHLVVISENFRNESRRFYVERAKTTELIINLQDSTPLIIFEAPENALIFLNNNPVLRDSGPIPVHPGIHEAKFLLGDYTLTRNINVQRGKTYKIAVIIGIDVVESD